MLLIIQLYFQNSNYYFTFCNVLIHQLSLVDRFFVFLLVFLLDEGLLDFSFFKFLFRLIPGDILHPHQYDLKEYSRFLESRNCKIEQAVCIKQEFFFDHYVLVARKL
mgnify:CR=1 FL=1